jgi:transposase-like protein
MSVERLSPELINDIAQLARAGNYRRTAAALVGVSEDTLYRWLQRGRQVLLGADHEHVCPRCRARDNDPCITANGNPLKEFHADRPRASQGDHDDLCLRLLQTLTRADEEAKARSVMAWNRAIDGGDWRAAKEFLARRWPAEWGQEPIEMHHTIESRTALEKRILELLEDNDED